MLTNTASALWTALEATPGQQAPWIRWQESLGTDLPAARGYLRRCAGLTEVYPCQVPGGCGCLHEVVSHGPDDHVAVPEEGACCDKFGLTDDQVTLWEWHRAGVERALIEALGVVPDPGSVAAAPVFQRLGYLTRGPRRRSVYWTLPRSRDGLWQSALAWAATEPEPAVLLMPTERRVSQLTWDLLTRRGILLRFLSQWLVLEPDGTLSVPDDPGLWPEEAGAPAGNRLVRQGALWQIAYAGRSVAVRQQQGMVYLARLLAAPEKAWAAEELMQAGVPVAQRAAAAGSAGPALDTAALADYRRRLTDVAAELDEAQADNDHARQERLEAEQEQILEHLRQTTGLGGRIRQTAEAGERARKAVSIALKRVLQLLEKTYPLLARHLEASLQLGRTVCYRPEPPETWTVTN